MKIKLLVSLCLLCHCVVNAMTIDVRKNGAVSDGVTDNTKIIQKAIDDCSAGGGGTVLLTGGGKFMTGTLYLKSYVTLHVANGTTLLGSPDINDYTRDTHKIMYKREKHMDRCFIYAENAESVGIEGLGTIDGNGHQKFFKSQRPMLIRFKDCNRITVKDITLVNPAAWTSAWLYCNDISVRGIRIVSRVNKNGDGLDFDGCTNVRVSDSSFDTSDDSICLQTSRKDKPCKDVVVTNCIFKSKWAGLRIGLLSMGEISSVTVSNCTFLDIDDSGLKIQQNEGGCMKNMMFSNLVMKNVPRPIFMTFCKQRACVDAPIDQLDSLQYMKNFVFSNFIVDNEELDKNCGIVISGIPGHDIENITIDNVNMHLAGGGSKADAKRVNIPEFDLTSMRHHWPEYSCLGGTLPSYGFFLRHVDGIKIRNCEVYKKTNDERKPIVKIDVKNFVIN